MFFHVSQHRITNSAIEYSSTADYYAKYEETFKEKEVSLPALRKWYGLGKKLLYLAYGGELFNSLL